MRFWDASAIVPLLLDEGERDPDMFVWWGSTVECVSAISRSEREGALFLADAHAALERLRALADAWQEILPTDVVRMTAQRLQRVHPLRAADSLQLAAAVVAAEGNPNRLQFVCLDERLTEAALREGFTLL